MSHPKGRSITYVTVDSHYPIPDYMMEADIAIAIVLIAIVIAGSGAVALFVSEWVSKSCQK